MPVATFAYVHKEWIFGEFMCHFENLFIFVRQLLNDIKFHSKILESLNLVTLFSRGPFENKNYSSGRKMCT